MKNSSAKESSIKLTCLTTTKSCPSAINTPKTPKKTYTNTLSPKRSKKVEHPPTTKHEKSTKNPIKYYKHPTYKTTSTSIYSIGPITIKSQSPLTLHYTSGPAAHPTSPNCIKPTKSTTTSVPSASAMTTNWHSETAMDKSKSTTSAKGKESTV